MDNLIWKKQSLFARFIKFFKRYGFWETMQGTGAYLLRQALYSTYPIYSIFFDKKSSFVFKGKKYRYCFEKYNLSWRNERTVEIPIISKLLKEKSKLNILEIGCVLKHYNSRPKFHWTIVDKYEMFDGVLNVDLLEYKPKKLFDFIFSISTFEHIGLEDGAVDSKKAKNAIEYVIKNCLKKNGQFIFTIPIGYNKYLDQQIFNNEIAISEKHYFAKIAGNKWLKVTKDQIVDSVYRMHDTSVKALFVGIIYKK